MTLDTPKYTLNYSQPMNSGDIYLRESKDLTFLP